MGPDIELWQAGSALVLVIAVVIVSWRLRLALGRSILWAAARATVQLLAVGLFFAAVFESDLANVWAWSWVAVMVVVAGGVVDRRAGRIPGLWWLGVVAIVVTVGVVLAVIFGLRILDVTPISVVVIAGITIGNTLPAVAQSVVRSRDQLREQAGQIDAMLALGFDGAMATGQVAREVTKLALVPQIERTRVVGLISLPGAMTGLLLAGVDPLDAVLIQLVVMFLVLGSIAVAVTFVTLVITRSALTDDLRLTDWARTGT